GEGVDGDLEAAVALAPAHVEVLAHVLRRIAPRRLDGHRVAPHLDDQFARLEDIGRLEVEGPAARLDHLATEGLDPRPALDQGEVGREHLAVFCIERGQLDGVLVVERLGELGRERFDLGSGVHPCPLLVRPPLSPPSVTWPGATVNGTNGVSRPEAGRAAGPPRPPRWSSRPWPAPPRPRHG